MASTVARKCAAGTTGAVESGPSIEARLRRLIGSLALPPLQDRTRAPSTRTPFSLENTCMRTIASRRCLSAGCGDRVDEHPGSRPLDSSKGHRGEWPDQMDLRPANTTSQQSEPRTAQWSAGTRSAVKVKARVDVRDLDAPHDRRPHQQLQGRHPVPRAIARPLTAAAARRGHQATMTSNCRRRALHPVAAPKTIAVDAAGGQGAEAAPYRNEEGGFPIVRLDGKVPYACTPSEGRELAFVQPRGTLTAW